MGESNGVPRTPRPGAPAGSARIAVFRVLLLALAAGGLAAAAIVGRIHDQAMDQSAARYVCPMHPDVTATRPGSCPICGMELELVGSAAGSSAIGTSTFQTYDFVRHRGFGLDMRAPAWAEDDGLVYAIVYNDVLPTLSADERAVFSASSAPGTSVDVRPTLDPPAPWDRSTSRVPFRVASAAVPPRRGEIGWVRLPGKRREVEVIPYHAVLEDRDGPYVLVGLGDGRTLTKRPIEFGRVIGGAALVLSGLRVQERVLVRGTFFVDAERRLRRQSTVEVSP